MGIYEAEHERLLALCTLLSGNHASGEDLAHSVFAEALRRERGEPGYLRDPVWPWLRIVAIRLASRQRARMRFQVERLHLLTRAVPSDVWDRETVDVVSALRRLPPRMRACIVLAYLEDQTINTIADLLDCAPKTVENQLHEGRHRLRELIGAGYGEQIDE